ncbi:GNAT family N-acetyltransferase [Sulfuricella sp.]|uniref:GNAT family N-acetyltransferase n=1 Tax=Sulfuricella sp. TaxID=2099377 RepID=UPI002D0939C6|nr:GNAT family N-acetyltransferase [Sulfuricella sp.]HUX64889.1 GNAT family N-acetyltransferase [Sulfuricella sp.]
MSQFRIVEAVHADLPVLAQLLGRLFSIESDFSPDAGKQTNGLRLIIENPALGSIFVLRVQDRIVGMANALSTISTAEGGPVLLLEDVIVAEAYRGQGLGSKLVQHVLAWAEARGFLRVTLLADRNNVPALRFYEKQGFLTSAMAVYRHGLAVG